MRWPRVQVGPGAGARVSVDAEVGQCPDCGRRLWFVFRLAGQTRLMLQCEHCNRVESADGKPLPEVDLYAVAAQKDDGAIHPLDRPGEEVTQ